MRSAQMGDWNLNLITHEPYWSSRCLELLGLPPDFTDFSSDVLTAIIHPDDRASCNHAIATAIESGGDYQQEFRVVWADGSVHWLADRGQVFYDQSGQAVRMMGVAFDITERKQAQLNEQFLSTLDLRLRQLSDADAMTLEVVRSVGEYLNADRCLWDQVDTIAGVGTIQQDWRRQDTPSIAGTYPIAEFILPDLVERFQAGHSAAISDILLCPYTAPFADNFRSLSIKALIGVPCIHQGCWVATLNVTAENARNWRPDEVALLQEIVARLWAIIEQARSVQALRQTAAELTQTNRLKDEFLAALSHELRTPLNPILGWTQMMQAQRLTSEETVEALETIDRNVRQQIRLVDDLLEISRVIQGKLKLELRLIDLVTTLQTAIDTVQFAAQAKAITLELRGLASLSLIADSDRLQQVFWNLLSNAIKFTPAGGRVEVDLSASGETNRDAHVRVTDTGVGIVPEFLPYVFERFRQADGSSTRQYGGLGLGLSIVQQLVELHGGKVTVASPGMGQGATFTVILPIREASVNPVPTADLNLSTTGQFPSLDQTQFDFTPALTGIRILVLDDDPDILDLLSFLLEQDGAVVTALSSPRSAIDRITQQSFDLIISDIGMPELDGYQFMQQIRTLPQGQSIPALALTAFVYQEDQAKAIQAGFQAYITKPVNPIELLEGVTQLVNR